MSESAEGGQSVPAEVRERIEADPVLTIADWLAYHDGDGGEDGDA